MQKSNRINITPPFDEAAILLRVSRVVSRAEKFSAGVERAAAILEQYVQATVLGTDVFGKNRLPREESYFEGNERYPHSYTVPLRDRGRDIGRIALGFAQPFDETEKRLARFIGEQVGMLFLRLRLEEKNLVARRSLQTMNDEMTERKLVPRVIALLASRYRMRRHEAESWLAAQSSSTGLTEVEVAERLIAGHGDAASLVVTGQRSRVRLTA
ncbi:MAG: ANTAR domain-containing protein [Bryobacteraceae bacterium]